MRLIDADILKIAFEEKGLSPVTNRIVDNVPTVDAEPVVHLAPAIGSTMTMCAVQEK